MPVIQGGTKGKIVDSCLKKSPVGSCDSLASDLHTNMRVYLHGDKAAGEFAGQQLAIGDSKYLIDTGPDIFSCLKI